MLKIIISEVLFLIVFHSSKINNVCSIKPFVLEEQVIWESSSQEDVSRYRIPIIVQAPNGDLLAFSEARKYSAADAGAKFIAMRRSTNRGNSWQPSVYVLNDYMVPDGLNLGSVIVDYVRNKIILMHTFCVHSVCNGTGGGEKPSGIYTVASSNSGFSWSEPVNVAEKNPPLTARRWDPGPGYGIQKQYAPHKGRLVACGHGPVDDNLSLYCLYSDDGGETWLVGDYLYSLPFGQTKKTGDFVPGEVQMVELKNGTILANVRNNYAFHCHCRIQVMSFDGGHSFPWYTLKMKEELTDPNCFGSLLNFNDSLLFFSNAFNSAQRVNMTLHWSVDGGQTYPNSLNIYGKGSAYSCLTVIDPNHIGLMFEKDDYKYISFVKIQLNL